MNRFKIVLGKEKTFEDVWKNRETHLENVPGFKKFNLVKGDTKEDHTLYASHSIWNSKEDFINWTKSEAFRLAHKNAGQHQDLYLGHPNFEGFEKIIDSIGGVEICVNETQREGYSFEIQKGCNNLNGEIALNWIVSRNTEILDGKKIVNENGEDISSWKPMPGVSDLTRIKKQQQLILSMMGKINNFESFNSFLNFVNALEDTFTIDNNISTIEASSLLWDFRDINFDNVNKLTVPTYNYKTESGAEVLILDDNFYNFIQSNNLLD